MSTSVDGIQQHVCIWCNRLQLSAAKESTESLRAMTGDMVSSSDLADLTRSAEAVEERSTELASKQAETLEQVAEELLCSPEIIRQALDPPCSLKTPLIGWKEKRKQVMAVPFLSTPFAERNEQEKQTKVCLASCSLEQPQLYERTCKEQCALPDAAGGHLLLIHEPGRVFARLYHDHPTFQPLGTAFLGWEMYVHVL